MNNCFKTVLTNDIRPNGEYLSLIIPDMELRHGQHIRICFAQTPPAPEKEPMKMSVIVSSENVPIVQSRMDGACGALSFLYTDQLQSCCGKIKARQYVDLVYSSDTLTFNYVGPCRCLPRANVVFPRVPYTDSKKSAKAEPVKPSK